MLWCQTISRSSSRWCDYVPVRQLIIVDFEAIPGARALAASRDFLTLCKAAELEILNKVQNILGERTGGVLEEIARKETAYVVWALFPTFPSGGLRPPTLYEPWTGFGAGILQILS